MSNKKKVNVVFQIIITISIPILVLFASYRIEKLRWGLVFIAMQALSGFVIGNFFLDIFYSEFIPFSIGNYETDVGNIVFLIVRATIEGFIIGIWSKQWNEKISASV